MSKGLLLSCYHKTRDKISGVCSHSHAVPAGSLDVRVLTVNQRWWSCCLLLLLQQSQNLTQSRCCLCSSSSSSLSHSPDSLWQAGSLPQELCFNFTQSLNSPCELTREFGSDLGHRGGSSFTKIKKKKK